MPGEPLDRTLADSQSFPAAQPTTLGRYTIVRELGRGGVGTVYAARDPQLDRDVAVKLVRSARFEDEAVRARLSREARAMAKVSHANVVTVYDAGEAGDGVFIAMELVVGTTLAGWLRERPRSPREIVRMFVAVGRGLAAAHAVGIVHRDFKPENVLVDRTGWPAVTDFGLAFAPALHRARSASGAAAEPPRGDVDDPGFAVTELPIDDLRTHIGSMAGTPRYMSPEQLRGEALDARTDQFSFAVALHEALHGDHPFAGATIEELWTAVLSGSLRPRPARTRTLADRALAPALRVERDQRYPTMTELLARLEAIAAPRRFAVPAAIGAAVLAAGVAIAAVAGAFSRGDGGGAGSAVVAAPAPPRYTLGATLSVVVTPFANTTGDPRFDDAPDNLVGDELGRADNLNPKVGYALAALARGAGLALQDADALAAKVAAATGDPSAIVHGTIARAPDGYELAIDVVAPGDQRWQAREHASSADDTVRVVTHLAARARTWLVTGRDQPDVASRPMTGSLDAEHAYVVATAELSDGRMADAIAAFERAVTADPAFAVAHGGLGLALADVQALGAADELARAAAGVDAMPRRQRLLALADNDDAIGRYDDEIAAYTEYLAIWPNSNSARINAVAAALNGQLWSVALELARTAAQRAPHVPVARANLVLADLGVGHLDEAARDADAMVAEIADPTLGGLQATVVADALVGRDPTAAIERTAKLGVAVGEQARADVAVFAGHPDQAERLLADRAAAVGGEVLIQIGGVELASLLLARGAREKAIAIARGYIANTQGRVGYVAASTVVAAGHLADAPALVRAWHASDDVEHRQAAAMLTGDLALARHDAAAAIEAYQDALRIGPGWLVHRRLGHAYLVAGARDDARRELTWCHDQRGQGASWLIPSLWLVADAERELAALR